MRTARQGGAALLMLLMVVAVGAASLFLSSAGGGRERALREERSIAIVGQAREALIGFALAHGRLPRPAMTADGAESGVPCTTDLSCTGLIPWRTLGIEGVDSWGKLLHYSVTPVFTESPIQRVTSFGTKTVLTRERDGSIRYVAGYPVCAPGTPCVAVVLFSGGRDDYPSVDERANRIATNDFMQRPLALDAGVPGGSFDDVVAWIAPVQLYAAMVKAKVLP